VILTTGTFFIEVIPLLVQVSWWTPEPCQHGTARGGITTSLQQTRGQPLVAFDILHLAGNQLIGLAYTRRRHMLDEVARRSEGALMAVNTFPGA
jgi:hypothetical protein